MDLNLREFLSCFREKPSTRSLRQLHQTETLGWLSLGLTALGILAD